MKTINVLVLMALIAGSVFLSSCNKDEEELGNLVVIVEDLTGENVWVGKTVYLYDSQEAFNNSEYVESAVTNDEGKVTFVDLDPKTYWFDCDFEVLGITYAASGSATVEGGMETTKTLNPLGD